MVRGLKWFKKDQVKSALMCTELIADLEDWGYTKFHEEVNRLYMNSFGRDPAFEYAQKFIGE